MPPEKLDQPSILFMHTFLTRLPSDIHALYAIRHNWVD